MAKAPVAGYAKTRLAELVGREAAAELAAASLLDTLDAVEEVTAIQQRLLGLSGNISRAARAAAITGRLSEWTVFPQQGTDFGARLAHAHRVAAKAARSPVLQIGTDTPQVTGPLLGPIANLVRGDAASAALGPADDGGWWALGVARPELAEGLRNVAMSTPDTGRATVDALVSRGAHVTLVHQLRDVDTQADAELVAREVPHTRFAAMWRSLGHRPRTAIELFDVALDGAPCVVHGGADGPDVAPTDKWRGTCDSVDSLVLDRCYGATLDVGCGPGRLAGKLASRGLPCLGVDLAAGTVTRAQARGADAVRRDVFSPLPGEGSWETVLLADGNIGIGGDPARLLRRAHSLLRPNGRVLVEVARPGTELRVQRLELEVAGQLSQSFRWATLGPEALADIAQTVSLRLLAVVTRGDRWYAELRAVDLAP
jgi:glycosyltransferase A (GT-A) superfamily protein (DUF2064 family)